MTDIFTDGIIKQKYILIHHRDLFQYPLCCHMIYRLTANGNCTTASFIVFCNQIQDCRLSASRIPDNGGQLLIGNRKGSVFQNRLSGDIGEIHIFKPNLMCSCLECLHTACFFRLVHNTQDFVFGNHQVFIAGEVYKNRVCQLCTEQRQHTDQKIVYRVQWPCGPGRIRCPNNQWAGQPA